MGSLVVDANNKVADASAYSDRRPPPASFEGTKPGSQHRVHVDIGASACRRGPKAINVRLIE
jgi:hypothetical protein